MSTTTLTEWHDAVITTIREGFESRAQALAMVGGFEPWVDFGDAPDDLVTPAVFVFPFSFRVIPGEDSLPSGRVRDDIEVTWRAYHILSTRTKRLPLALLEMANITRAIVHLRPNANCGPVGNRWGLGDALEYPEGSMLPTERVDPQIAGHSCVMLEWQQIGYLADTLI